MRFWDASAVIPLCVRQDASATALAWHRADPDMVAWWSTPVECTSAFCRLHREGLLAPEELQAVDRWLKALQGAWYEVQPTPEVRRRAVRLLHIHPLRAADAAQLAAALTWAAGDADGLAFVSGDRRLAEAARQEGFQVMDPFSAG